MREKGAGFFRVGSGLLGLRGLGFRGVGSGLFGPRVSAPADVEVAGSISQVQLFQEGHGIHVG